jgi:hypothetical protein
LEFRRLVPNRQAFLGACGVATAHAFFPVNERCRLARAEHPSSGKPDSRETLVMLQRLRRSSAVVVVLVVPLGLAACGESSEEKADKQVCSAVSEIQTQIKKLESLSISSSFPTEAKTSVEAIDKSVGKIKEAAPKISSARKEEIETANKSFQTEIAAVTASVVSATKSANLEAALKAAAPRIKSALSTLSGNYKKAFEALKC